MDQGNDVTLIRGNHSDYLAARLKRDAPEIAERLAADPFLQRGGTELGSLPFETEVGGSTRARADLLLLIIITTPDSRYPPSFRTRKFKIILIIMNNHGKLDAVNMYHYPISEHSRHRVSV